MSKHDEEQPVPSESVVENAPSEEVMPGEGMSESRRGFMKKTGIAAGAVVGAAAMPPLLRKAGYDTGGPFRSAHAATYHRTREFPPADRYASDRPNFLDVYSQIGNEIMLLPGKFSGGIQAVDMGSGVTKAWMAMWNFGDEVSITHHMAAFPSEDPYKGFEYVINTQGGQNMFIYGVPTTIENPAEGQKIYRIKYDGTRMEIQKEASQQHGIGLGVHVTITPEADGYGIGDGQKDIAAEFDRETDDVRYAYRFDWESNKPDDLERAWLDGGTIKISRLKPGSDGKYDYYGAKGNKIDWELVPGGELFIEQGKVSGDSPETVTAVDAMVFDPRGRWSVVSLRVPAMCIVFDRETQSPVAALSGPDGTPSQMPLEQLDDDTWQVVLEEVPTAAHQAGFSPDGNSFLFMNSLRQNNIMVWDSSNHGDPSSWEKKAMVSSPDWRGAYPNTFHMAFTPDSKKVYVTLWWPSPTPNGIAVVDAENWELLSTVDLGPDMHTLAVTPDGRHVIGVISGYQQTESAIVVMETETDQVLGFMPSPMGHHDNVIVPRDLVGLRHSRSTTT